jgi:UDP-N-acetylmuramoylalanine--D-glutamate ligase
MILSHLRNCRVLVLGLGDTGLAMASWCARFGAQVTVWDSRAEPPQGLALRERVPTAVQISGVLDAAVLQGMQWVLRSPGLSPLDAQMAPLLALAQQTGVLVQGELDVFADALAALKAERGYAPKVIAITGTNGKTTTTAMTGQLVARCGLRVAVAGNIGPTMLDTLAAALDLEGAIPSGVSDDQARAGLDPRGVTLMSQDSAGYQPALQDTDALESESAPEDFDAADFELPPAGIEEDEDAAPTEGGGPPAHLIPPPPKGPVFAHLPEIWVLELSSFQLDGVQRFAPSAGAVLNLSEDHLDWHGEMAHYVQAKARVFGPDGVMVLNQDDAQVLAMAPKAPALVKGKPVKFTPRQIVRFGLGSPQHAGDFGLRVENEIAWLVRAEPLDETLVKRKRGAAAVMDEPLQIRRLMPADALRIRGRHNAANALAALALASSVGCPLGPMLHGLREYAGEPHRLQFVALVRGVHFYDDSKGTNVGAALAALQGLGQEQHPAKLVVILGGDGKGQDFAPLREAVRQRARAVATLGRDAAAIALALQGSGVPLENHATLEAATCWAFAQAQPGDAVLLSPACASLDMFRNYAHRAQVFVAQVQVFAQDLGIMA